MKSLRVIYVGDLRSEVWGTCLQRMRALQDLGHAVIGINAVQSGAIGLLQRLQIKVVGFRPDHYLGWLIGRAVRRIRPDVLWLDKALTVSAQTLCRVREIQPSIVILGYSPDDMMNPSNQSKCWLNSLPLHDAYLTTKSYGVDELKSLGCKTVLFVANAYDPSLHRPFEVTPSERQFLGGPVGFVGAPEKERAENIAWLSGQGICVKVWGDGWKALKRKSGANYLVGGGSVWGTAYVKVLSSFDINLCFLRKVNRDRQTTRSIEIPACKGFMLAERTDEHLGLFEEGKEAEFFSSNEELLDKVKFYLAHDSERRQIALAGHNRCVEGGYSNQVRLKKALSKIDALRER